MTKDITRVSTMQWADCENITLICLELRNDEVYRNFLNTSSLEHFPNLTLLSNRKGIGTGNESRKYCYDHRSSVYGLFISNLQLDL